MGSIPLVLEVDGEEVFIEADPNEKLIEVCSRAVPPEKWDESIISTTAGIPVDPNRPIKELIRETNETRFRVVSEGHQGAIPDFPQFLWNATVNSPNWPYRAREELIRIKMLNNLLEKVNPGFAHIYESIYSYNGLKLIKGWVRVENFGSVQLSILLPPAYPLTYPETALHGRFFDKYNDSTCFHKHVYKYRINGEEVSVICGDERYLSKWTGRLGVAHYVSDVVFPWIHIAHKQLRGNSDFGLSKILKILRGD